jgi:hypothetical protein
MSKKAEQSMGPIGRRWRATIASEATGKTTSETAWPWPAIIPFVFCFNESQLGLDWPWWAQALTVVAMIHLCGIALVLRDRYCGRSSRSGAPAPKSLAGG